MYKDRMQEHIHGSKTRLGYVEMDPSGRYGRFKEVLGKGATKMVYKAFDEYLATEVAWNQVKLNDVFRSPEELQRLYSEVHLLKDLDHVSIMRFHMSWIDVDRRTFNFITEMFTSGSLREYRQKHKRVNIRAIKEWARQILEGLVYLHGHEPPVIHRDLKCDNIFVNGHLGQVKIGDLGLAATLCESQHAHSVIGTPEFMAPELYEEEYNELVDIYSFGMCVLEMLTSEYPYSECSNPAQIYKKVTSGKLPKAFYQIEDAEARRFVGKCLENASRRPSAKELLMDPFLLSTEDEQPVAIPYHQERPILDEVVPKVARLSVDPTTRTTNMTITGTMNTEDDTIFLKVMVSDKHGKARNIYFPFDILSDTAIDVANEMVKELEINDWEPVDIADMIDEEISALVPTWKKWDCTENQYEHCSFNYDDDDGEDRTPHHSYSFSCSRSSSEISLQGVFASSQTLFHRQPSHVEDFLLDIDDASSQSSLNSHKYSNVIYCSENESECESSSSVRGDIKMQNFTRFCGEQTKSGNNQAPNSNQLHRKVKRVGSLVDVRSQLLHRSLVEEINKRHMFKTVAAIENIGYHEPQVDDVFSGKEWCGSASRLPGKAQVNCKIQGFGW